MPESPIPDRELMAQLELSVRGMDWAAGLLKRWQHTTADDIWSGHHQLKHLLAVETENFQPRIRRILQEKQPLLISWDTNAFDAGYTKDGDIEELAATFVVERTKTVEMFQGLDAEQWARTAIWPDGREIDLAWLAGKVLWHSLDHFQQLLDLHGEFEPKVGERWLAG